jgi:DNA-directed RNA polymerase specialized sigma24 family protein
MMTHCVVRWQDGSFDNNRECIVCGAKGTEEHVSTCKNPCYKEFYKERIVTKSYQNYLDDLNPETQFAKDFAFDPDQVVFRSRTTGPAIEDETEKLILEATEFKLKPNFEAYCSLTDKQKAVWDCIMQRGISEYSTAAELGISRDAVHDRINKARAAYKKFIKQQKAK